MFDYYNKEADSAYTKKMLEEDDKFIKFYEKKLGLTKKKETHASIRLNKDLQKDGFDADLFDFLDNISKRVKTDKSEDKLLSS
jgi:hypothetical protein